MDFIDLKSQYARIETTLVERLRRVLVDGRFIMGPEVAELEQTLAAWVGSRHCVSCANGTDALHLALLCHGIGAGDVVFTSPFTFAASAEVISLRGATPVFVDVHPRTFNLEPQALERAVERVRKDGRLQARGIIAVDLFGLPADYDALMELARREGLFVVQDAAQSFGATSHGQRSPGLTDLGTTSFFPAKPLGCYGDGGALFTNDDDVAAALRSLRSHGKGSHKYEHTRIGLNSRLDTLQAAVLLEKFRIFPAELELRERVAQRYTQALESILQVPEIPPGRSSAWAQYSVCHAERDDLLRELKRAGIPTMVYYPVPLHLQPCYADLGYRKGDLPVSEDLSERIFSLPMSPYLAEEDQDRVVETLQKLLSPKRRPAVMSQP
jgi:dTDP-4-amino-4,6-dideoxygalactose transaminase